MSVHLGASSPRGSILVLCIAVCASVTGCIIPREYFPRDEEDPRPWPPAADAGKQTTVRLSVVVYGAYDDTGRHVHLHPDTLLMAAREAYASSGLFSQGGPDMPIDLCVEVEGTIVCAKSDTLFYACCFTVFVVPYVERYTVDWKTTFKDASGEVRGVVKRKSEVDVVIEFLIYLMPFVWHFGGEPYAVENELSVPANRATINDALERGYLRPEPARRSP